MLLLIFSDLLLQIFRQFLRPLVERVVVPQIFVHGVPGIIQLRLELLAVGLGLRRFGRQRFLLAISSL